MGRHPDPQRKYELLNRVVDYVLDEGLGDLSLRPLAKALGTSPRMLLYHFGSKEQLMLDALDAAAQRQRHMLEEWLAADPPLAHDPAELMRRFWRWTLRPPTQPYLRLFFEVYGLAVQNPDRWQRVLDRAVRPWLATIEERLLAAGVPPEEAETLATLAVATHRGLLLDLLSTGEQRRVQRAHDNLMSDFDRYLEGLREEALR
jgi:AcrR family transcriptional regulator